MAADPSDFCKEWNAENFLTKVEKNGAEVARFGYDPYGRRVEKVAGGATATYTYDGADILREVHGGTTLLYVNGPAVDDPLAVESNNALGYYHMDGLGSIVRMTNAAGAATLTRQYDAWGNLEAGGSEPGPAFTGREWDPETGLYYYRARYYDPKAGRFVSEDPIRFTGGVDFYAYVINGPTVHTDPFGLAWWDPRKWWDAWKQYKKHKKCIELVIECDKRVKCKCSSDQYPNDASRLNRCEQPGSACCSKIVILCEADLPYNVDDCAPPVPPPPDPTPPPPPNPCNVYGQTSKQCSDWWEKWKKNLGEE